MDENISNSIQTKEYSFDIIHAKKYGVNEAIMLKNFIFWIDKNKANRKHFHDGYYWTYNSVQAFTDIYPFWSEHQIRRIIDNLVKFGIIIKGNFNEHKYERTLWYTVDENKLNNDEENKNDKSILPNGQMVTGKLTNANGQKGICSTDNKPNINTYKKRKNTDSSESVIHPSEIFPIEKIDSINPNILSILKEFIPKGEFRNKLPIESNGKITKTIKKVEEIILQIKNKTFATSYKFDEQWFNTNNISLSYLENDLPILSWEDITRLLNRAIKRFAKMRKIGYWPISKDILTTDIPTFFYNPRNQRSWFLYCLSNPVMEMKDKEDKIDIEAIKKGISKNLEIEIIVYDSLPDEYFKEISKLVKKEEWKESIFWLKIEVLSAWWGKYRDNLYSYNQQINGVWISDNWGSFLNLLYQIDQFSKTWKEWSIGNFGLGNKTWILFCEWIKKRLKIDIDIDKEILKEYK